MMAARRLLFVLFALFLVVGLHAQEIRFTLLQLNDLYEITPINGGKEGGLARVATLRNQLARQNRHV